MDQDKINEAQSVVNWSLFSDKEKDEKPSDMTVEEAESILYKAEKETRLS